MNKVLAVTIGMTIAFGLVVFGFQTGNLLLTLAGGAASIGIVLALEFGGRFE